MLSCAFLESCTLPASTFNININNLTHSNMDTPEPEQAPQTPDDTNAAALTEAAEALERLRAQQSLPIAIIAGLAAAVIGAVLWAGITYATNHEIGWMAIGVGFLVGFAIRFGRGIDKIFNALGAGFALFGCLLGKVFTIYAFVAKEVNVSVFEVAGRMDFDMLTSIMGKAFSPIDLLFYGLAIWAGWQYSTQRITAAA